MPKLSSYGITVLFLTSIIVSGVLSVIPITNLQHSLIVQVSNGAYTTTQDGTTTYTGSSAYQAIQTAINTAKPGETIQIKAGIYPIDTKLTGKTGVSLKGENMPVLDFSSRTANNPANSYYPTTLMTTSGVITATTYPTANLTKGQNTVTTTTSIGASVGDLIFIRSTVVWRNCERGQLQGEIRSVTQANSNILTLEAPLEDTYTKSTTTIYRINPVKDITIDGIKFQNTVFSKDFEGLYFTYGDNIRITNCEFSKIELMAVAFFNCVNSRVDHCRFMDCTTYGFGYGVSLAYACQNVTVEDNEAYRCRHWVAIGGGTAYGIPRHITVQNNYSEDSVYWKESTQEWLTAHQYDCHPVGEDIDFLYNEATGKGIGIYSQAYSGNITGNHIHDLTTGGSIGIGVGLSTGWVGSDGLIHYQDEMIIQGNTVSNTILWGIQVGNDNPRYASNVKVLDNKISGCPAYGIMTVNSKDCHVNRNTIMGVMATGDTGIYLGVTTSNIQGSGNSITGCTIPITNYGLGNNVS